MDLYLDDILSDQNRKVLEDLFESLLKRVWKVTRKDLTFAEETVRILSYSFEEDIKDKRNELLKLSEEVLQKVFLASDTKFNPLAVLLSETNLYLCEISKIPEDVESRFSLLGIFAKKYECTDTILVGRLSSSFEFFENHHTMITINVNHLDNDVRKELNNFLIFSHDNTAVVTSAEEFHPAFVHKITNSIIENLKKPKGNISTMPSILPN